jgi:5-methylcytosine-specific restriction endonuclease McrA
MTAEDFQKLIDNSTSLSDVIKKCGFSVKEYYYKIIRGKIIKDKIDLTKMNKNFKTFKNNVNFLKSTSNDQIFKKNSKYSRYHLKQKIIKDKIIEYICDKCKNNGIWQDGKLILQLDHINSINDDNRIENLRFLCPNCHSQTDGYAGKGKNKTIYKKRYPNGKINKTVRKFEVTKEKLEELISKYPYNMIGKVYGVNGNSIKKRCKSLGIILTNRKGFWQKLYGCKPVSSCILEIPSTDQS